MDSTLRCLLLDDELPGLRYLRTLCEGIPEVEVIRAFNDPLKFLHESQTLAFDLCIMDIEMPHLNGLELAAMMKGKAVIFTTAYKEYAAEAFDIEAIDYIRKPFQKERLSKAIQKAFERVHESKKVHPFVSVNTNKGKALLYFDRIRYITTMEYDSRDKLVLMSDGEMIIKNTGFDKILSFLPSTEFCRINKKDIIALKSVRFFSYKEIHVSLTNSKLDKGITLPLTENYRTAFLARLNTFQ